MGVVWAGSLTTHTFIETRFCAKFGTPLASNRDLLVIASSFRGVAEKIKSKENFTHCALTKDCQHLTLSVMRSGPDVSAYCTKCWKLVFKSKEAIVWKYSLASTFKKEDPGCVGKIAKLYRTDRFVTARCMTCDYHVRGSEFKIERNAVVNPRIEPVKSVWKISS